MPLTALLEVVLGIGFPFAVLSLVASGVNELVAACGLRARTLQEGIANVLADPEEAQALYRYALIQPLYRGNKRPSYIPRDKFALALLDAEVRPAVNAVEECVAEVGRALDELPPGQVKDTLDLLWRDARNDVVRFRRNVEGWFDESMKRVSGGTAPGPGHPALRRRAHRRVPQRECHHRDAAPLEQRPPSRCGGRAGPKPRTAAGTATGRR